MRLYSAVITLFLLISIPGFAQTSGPRPYCTEHTHGRVEGGYLAASDLYTYSVDLNVDFDIGAWKEARFAFGGGILLYADSDEQMFQPDRFRGTFEPQVYTVKGPDIYAFSIRHQSFHDVDSLPPGSMSYEIINLSYLHRGRPNIWAQLGKFINQHGVDYEWNAYLDIDTGYIGRCRYGPVYVRGTGRYVGESGQIPDRHEFFDYNLETGLQTTSGVRYFTAYRQIHDINEFDGVTDHQWVIGIRYVW